MVYYLLKGVHYFCQGLLMSQRRQKNPSQDWKQRGYLGRQYQRSGNAYVPQKPLLNHSIKPFKPHPAGWNRLCLQTSKADEQSWVADCWLPAPKPLCKGICCSLGRLRMKTALEGDSPSRSHSKCVTRRAGWEGNTLLRSESSCTRTIKNCVQQILVVQDLHWF